MTRRGKVAVVGAGFYGSTTAQRLAEYDVFDEVVLTDIIEGRPEGVEAEIGRSGVRRIVERDLAGAELDGLRTAAEAVRAKQADVASL